MRIWTLYAILGVLIAISSNAQIAYRLSLSTQVSPSADTLYASVFAFRESSSLAFAFGSSNLLFDFDTISLDINQNGLLNQGVWSNDLAAGGSPQLYLNMLLGRGVQSNFLNLQIRQSQNTSLAGTLLLPDQSVLVARFWVGIKNCRASNTLRWKTTAPPLGAITSYQNQQIRSGATFVNPTPGPLHVPLLAPVPVFSLGTSSIGFSWPSQPQAIGYRISVNNGQSWRNLGLGLSFDTLGLGSADSVTLLVQAISGCDTAQSALVIARLPGCTVFPPAPLAASDTGRCGFGSMVLKARGSAFEYRWYTESVTGLLAGRRSDTLNIILSSALDTFYVSSINALGCESQSRTRIIVGASTLAPAPIITFNDSACTGLPFQISASGSPSNQGYSWQLPNGFSVINSNADSSTIGVIANLPGNFTITTNLKNGFCKSIAQRSILILSGSGLQILSSPADSSGINQPITFSTSGTYASYLWSFGDGQFSSLAQPVHQYQVTGSYVVGLKVSQNAGLCADSATINYKIIEPSVVFVPNVFAPSAQTTENRTLKVYGENISEQNFVFRIYNRWGQLIWQTNSFVQANQTGWDGSFQSADLQNYSVFTYILKGLFKNGRSFDKTGTVMLIN